MFCSVSCLIWLKHICDDVVPAMSGSQSQTPFGARNASLRVCHAVYPTKLSSGSDLILRTLLYTVSYVAGSVST